MEKKPLVDKNYLLEKFPGKGGWTFARIGGISKNKNAKFGYVKVKGTIDDFPISKYHLMPMKDGNLFLPVKSEIRKKINKEEGDYIHVTLYPDNEPQEIPDEMLLCLKEEPGALNFFDSLSESEKRYYIQWIYSAKKEETKINRMAKSITRLLNKEKFYEYDV